ncbi:extracellular solute-binding protein [Paenibacillus plantiphilus]|uniref:extracellular solute-binding protein n=1 Tax=Paenibacillus plantiphilus TaxID=2905650 RepID=UPI001F333B20|nr:extracellular solute-binding protein [Paenibacillus plantiphilus]
MARRKYMLFLMALFTICGVLLVQMLGSSGSMKATLEGIPYEYQPQRLDNVHDEAAPIQVAVSMDDREFQYWERVNIEIGNEYPDLEVELTNFNKDEAYESWLQSAQLGGSFDIIVMDNHLVQEFAVNGFLLPMDDLYARDSLVDHLKALTEPLLWNGSIWGVPVDSDPIVMVWNQELLNIVGQKPPATWEGFHSLFTGMSKSNPSLKAVNMHTGSAAHMAAWLGAFTGSIAESANLSLFNDVMKAQIRFALMESSSLDPGHEKAELLQQFRDGNLLSAVMPWSQYKQLSGEELNGMNVVSGVPSFSWDGGRSFVVMSQTSQLQRSRQWINIMTTSSRQLDRYGELGKLPTRHSVYTKEYVSKPIVSRPPNWIVEPLQQPVFRPDPLWSERWKKWQQLWSSPMLGLSNAEQAEYLIREWNGQEGRKRRREDAAEGAID